MAHQLDFKSDAPWVPPNVYDVQFRNCTLVADWVLNFFTYVEDLPYRTTDLLIRDGLSQYWRDSNITQPNSTELVQWAFTDGNPLLFLQAFNYTTGQCKEPFCKKLPWEGNSDLAGRGMVANYCIQAAFVTIYMAFHMAARFGWSPARRTAPYQILTAVQESTRPFLDATLLFSIAVHIATLFSFIRGHALDIPIPTTAGVSSAFISIYTIFPPLILHSCAADHLRRKHGRRYIWSALGAISLTMAGLYFSDPGGAWRRDWKNWSDFKLQNPNDKELMDLLYKDPDHQLKWESSCVTRLGADRANWAFTLILGIVFVIAVFTLIFLGNAFRIPFLRGERCSPLRKVRQYKWVISAFLALQAMWVCLGIFFWFRHELNKYTGDLNKDQEWTFGQVLAVATWAPVLMEVYVLWRDGAEKGLTGLLSDRFVVVDVTQVESAAGKENGLESSQPSDVEDQTQNQAGRLETPSMDEQTTGSRERSHSLDLSNSRENGPDRAQTAPQ